MTEALASMRRYLPVEIYQQPIRKTASGARKVDYDRMVLPSFGKGLYVYCTKYSGQRLLPWYVGKTASQTFAQRLQQDDSVIKQDKILQDLAWHPRKHPVLLIAFIDCNALSKPEIDGLESFLIKDAKRMNSELINVMKTSDHHKGPSHTSFSIIGFKSGEFRCPQNRGTMRQKADGDLLCRTLGHGR